MYYKMLNRSFIKACVIKIYIKSVTFADINRLILQTHKYNGCLLKRGNEVTLRQRLERIGFQLPRGHELGVLHSVGQDCNVSGSQIDFSFTTLRRACGNIKDKSDSQISKLKRAQS